MLATLIPMFDESMTVKAYSIFAQKENLLIDPIMGGSKWLDSAGWIPGFDIIDAMGINTLADDKLVFVAVNQVSIFTDIQAQSDAPPDRVVLLIDSHVKPTEQYLDRITELRKMGYKFAIWKLPLNEFGDYQDILNKMDYVLLNHEKINVQKAQAVFRQIYPHLKLVAINVDFQEQYEKLREIGGFSLFEGGFFRLPTNKADTEAAPLKATYIDLLRIVNDFDYDLDKAADVIGRDPALVISLLKMVNRMTVNSGITSVRHAAAMLGQKELKRWINTAVTKELCADKPSEITRLSLLRARFAENLAVPFELGQMQQELFLMGLFSVLDIILDRPMEEALATVQVSKQISDALLYGKGALARVLEFMKQYESASWQEVSRVLVLKNLAMDSVYEAYLESLQWYRDLISIPAE